MTTNTLIKEKNKTLNNEQVITTLFNEIEQIIVNSRNEIAYQVNNALGWLWDRFLTIIIRLYSKIILDI